MARKKTAEPAFQNNGNIYPSDVEGKFFLLYTRARGGQLDVVVEPGGGGSIGLATTATTTTGTGEGEGGAASPSRPDEWKVLLRGQIVELRGWENAPSLASYLRAKQHANPDRWAEKSLGLAVVGRGYGDGVEIFVPERNVEDLAVQPIPPLVLATYLQEKGFVPHIYRSPTETSRNITARALARELESTFKRLSGRDSRKAKCLAEKCTEMMELKVARYEEKSGVKMDLGWIGDSRDMSQASGADARSERKKAASVGKCPLLVLRVAEADFFGYSEDGSNTFTCADEWTHRQSTHHIIGEIVDSKVFFFATENSGSWCVRKVDEELLKPFFDVHGNSGQIKWHDAVAEAEQVELEEAKREKKALKKYLQRFKRETARMARKSSLGSEKLSPTDGETVGTPTNHLADEKNDGSEEREAVKARQRQKEKAKKRAQKGRKREASGVGQSNGQEEQVKEKAEGKKKKTAKKGKRAGKMQQHPEQDDGGNDIMTGDGNSAAIPGSTPAFAKVVSKRKKDNCTQVGTTQQDECTNAQQELLEAWQSSESEVFVFQNDNLFPYKGADEASAAQTDVTQRDPWGTESDRNLEEDGTLGASKGDGANLASVQPSGDSSVAEHGDCEEDATNPDDVALTPPASSDGPWETDTLANSSSDQNSGSEDSDDGESWQISQSGEDSTTRMEQGGDSSEGPRRGMVLVVHDMNEPKRLLRELVEVERKRDRRDEQGRRMAELDTLQRMQMEEAMYSREAGQLGVEAEGRRWKAGEERAGRKKEKDEGGVGDVGDDGGRGKQTRSE